MNLTKTERWTLSNQFRILEALYPDEAAAFARARAAVECGYEQEYRWLSEHISDEALAEEECREVADILTMFDDLAYHYGRLSDTAGIDTTFLKFPGFYGNTEARYLGYAQYLLGDEDRWVRLDRNGDPDSHGPFLATYRRMLAEYRKVPPPEQLSRDDVARILAAAKATE